MGNIKPKNEWVHRVKWDLVVFEEYHFGAWREAAKELFEGEEDAISRAEARLDDAERLKQRIADLNEPLATETEFLPITTKAYLYLSGTPFRALSTGEFIEEQIFNWTYTHEQRAKEEYAAKHPAQRNPYGPLPQMRLLTYQMPDELLAIASAREFDEFDLNAFFDASGEGKKAEFKHKSEVQKWLDIIRGGAMSKAVEFLKTGTRPPFPYSDSRLLPYLQHSFWFLPNVAACHAMANLLAEKHNTFWHKLVQEKLIKFATRIPAFMYLTDFRENTLQDVITKLEPDLFLAVTGLTIKDFHLLVRLKVFNTEQMNQAVFAFRRYEDASLSYTGIESHEGLTQRGGYDTVVAIE
ncbi:hypothetical protein BH11PLA2_BH11PLA2_46910 [soil metagenome]